MQTKKAPISRSDTPEIISPRPGFLRYIALVAFTFSFFFKFHFWKQRSLDFHPVKPKLDGYTIYTFIFLFCFSFLARYYVVFPRMVLLASFLTHFLFWALARSDRIDVIAVIVETTIAETEN